MAFCKNCGKEIDNKGKVKEKRYYKKSSRVNQYGIW